MDRIIVICGPTGIGKTSFAIQLARRFKGEIIGADSMQIYKHMDIGTAKPSPQEQLEIRHHLVDFVDPKTEFDAGKFVTHADRAIQDILGRGKVPVVAGGTGLYLKALLNGLFRSHPVCEQTLSRLNRELEQKGHLALHHQLHQSDPEAARKIHPNDTFRVIRALEVFLTTGRRISEQQQAHCFGDKRYDALKIGLFMDRTVLYDRINHRVDLMIQEGLLEEVKQLVKKGYGFHLKPMQSIGYSHMGMFIRGEVTWEEAVRLLKRDTRRYAKRQFTWFRKDKEIIWVQPDRYDQVEKRIKEFLT